jgi:hypothetical protein
MSAGLVWVLGFLLASIFEGLWPVLEMGVGHGCWRWDVFGRGLCRRCSRRKGRGHEDACYWMRGKACCDLTEVSVDSA